MKIRTLYRILLGDEQRYTAATNSCLILMAAEWVGLKRYVDKRGPAEARELVEYLGRQQEVTGIAKRFLLQLQAAGYPVTIVWRGTAPSEPLASVNLSRVRRIG